MSKKANRLAGYRLHKERILFSGGQIVRTIKYPLALKQKEDEEEKLFLEQFKKAVVDDDLKIRGDLNLNDYLQSRAQKLLRYTLFDFWRDSLQAGAVWAPKTAGLIDFVNRFYPSFPSPVDTVWENASPKITNFFDKKKFKEILLSDPVRNNTTRSSFEKRLKNYLGDSFKKREGGTFLVTSPNAGEVIDFILESFFSADGSLTLNGPQQEEFWRREFNLDKKLIEKAKPMGELKDITFLIIPELIGNLSLSEEVDELISRREDWLEKKGLKGEEKDEWQERILGLTDNFNSFSNYYGKALKALQGGKEETIFTALETILPSLAASRSEVMAALRFLSAKSKELSLPSLPLVSSWADYRSVFGGKIRSWFSNTARREKELALQIENFKKSLKKAETYLAEKNDLPKEAQSEKEAIMAFLGRLEEFFLKTNNTIKNEKEYEIFDSLLSNLKRRLNFFYQSYLSAGDEGGEKVDQAPAFEGLYERIYKPVAFFGEASRQNNEKFIFKTIAILEDGETIIRKVLLDLKQGFSPEKAFQEGEKRKETEAGVYRKFLQFFWNKYRNKAVNSSFFRGKYEQVLKTAAKDSFGEQLLKKDNQSRYTFYRSPYSKGTLIEIELKEEDPLVAFKRLVLELVDLVSGEDRETLLKDGDFFLDWIELAKHLIANLLHFNRNEEFSLEGLDLTNFDRANSYLDLFSLGSVKKNEFGFLIQSLILAEVKGAATLYSKKEYTAKYTIQVIGADERFLLFYQPLDPQINLSTSHLETKQLMKAHHYFVALGRPKLSYGRADEPNLIHLGKRGFRACYLPAQKQKHFFVLPLPRTNCNF